MIKTEPGTENFEIDLGEPSALEKSLQDDTMEIDNNNESSVTATADQQEQQDPAIKREAELNEERVTYYNKMRDFVKNIQLDKLNLSGVDNLSTDQVRSYVRKHGNVRGFTLQWVNDTSVNIVLLQPQISFIILRNLTQSPSSSSSPDTIVPINAAQAQVFTEFFNFDMEQIINAQEELSRQLGIVSLPDLDNEAEAAHAASFSPEQLDAIRKCFVDFYALLLKERPAIPYTEQSSFNDNQSQQQQQDGEKLKVRFAIKSDVKAIGSRSKSRYYLLHGEPTPEDDLIAFGKIRYYDLDEIEREERLASNARDNDLQNNNNNNNDEEILPAKILNRLNRPRTEKERASTLGSRLSTSGTNRNNRNYNNNNNEGMRIRDASKYNKNSTIKTDPETGNVLKGRGLIHRSDGYDDIFSGKTRRGRRDDDLLPEKRGDNNDFTSTRGLASDYEERRGDRRRGKNDDDEEEGSWETGVSLPEPKRSSLAREGNNRDDEDEDEFGRSRRRRGGRDRREREDRDDSWIRGSRRSRSKSPDRKDDRYASKEAKSFAQRLGF